jgi:prepilin-type processing-associated H-X9-DG protein
MSAHFENDPEFHDATPKSGPRRGSRLIEVLVFFAVIALLFALSLPAYRSAREEARRASCTNKLKAIELALLNYESEHGALPPAYTVDPNGRPLHSWRTLILPYLEQNALYRTIDLSKPWNDPANAKALEEMPSEYRCLSAAGPPNTTSYLAITGPDGYLNREKPRRVAEITDGTSSTLAVIEADDEHAIPWMAPVDADGSLVLGLRPTAKFHHPGGFNAALADGSVRFLQASLPATVRRALMTIDAKETITADQY